MIKANELRIGNRLLYHINEDGIEWDICTIDWQDLKWISQDPEGFNKKHKPVALTEEVLKAWGFICFAEHGRIFSEWFLNFDGILKYKILQDKRIKNCFTFPNENKPIKLKHLHQLQNLYFALTGEELKPSSN